MSRLKDVAVTAKVSPITVSRVLNDSPLVKPATKERVQRIMEQMAYVPNPAAKNLVTKRTGIIDVYVPHSIEMSHPFSMHFITGISEVLGERMFSLVLKRSWEQEHGCDGYIVTGLLTNDIRAVHAYAKKRNRIIALFGHTGIKDVDCIDVDNIFGAHMAVDHLIENGHTSIAMINVAEDKDYTLDRYTGYRNALEDAGLPVKPPLVLRAENSINGGYTAAKKLLKIKGLTAIFCASDVLALGAISGITDAGLTVPGSISIVGYDGLGIDLLSEPHITTIRQPVIEIGRVLANTIVDRICGKTGRTTGLIKPSLLPGKTVARRRG